MQLEAASGAGEARDAGEGCRGVEPEPDEHGERAGGVDGVVATGDAEGRPVRGALVVDRERHGTVGLDGVHADRGIRGLAEADDPLVREACGDARGAGVVGGDDDEFARPVAEVDEGLLERVARAVVVEVVGVDVRDERDRGVVEQERPVRLVGLDDEELALTGCRADAELLDDAAVHEARVLAELEQAGDDHAGRRGLAVRAGDGHEALAGDEPGEGLRTVQHGQPAVEGELVLGVVLPQRAGHDDRVGVANVGGVVSDRDLGAEVAQGGDVRRVAHVGSGDAMPGAEEQARDAAHAGAADADEVHGAELGGDLGGEVGLDGHVRRFFLGASMAV